MSLILQDDKLRFVTLPNILTFLTHVYGLETLNIVKTENSDNRYFSPIFQKGIILSKDNVYKFLKIVNKKDFWKLLC